MKEFLKHGELNIKQKIRIQNEVALPKTGIFHGLLFDTSVIKFTNESTTVYFFFFFFVACICASFHVAGNKNSLTCVFVVDEAYSVEYKKAITYTFSSKSVFNKFLLR